MKASDRVLSSKEVVCRRYSLFDGIPIMLRSELSLHLHNSSFSYFKAQRHFLLKGGMHSFPQQMMMLTLLIRMFL